MLPSSTSVQKGNHAPDSSFLARVSFSSPQEQHAASVQRDRQFQHQQNQHHQIQHHQQPHHQLYQQQQLDHVPQVPRAILVPNAFRPRTLAARDQGAATPTITLSNASPPLNSSSSKKGGAAGGRVSPSAVAGAASIRQVKSAGAAGVRSKKGGNFRTPAKTKAANRGKGKGMPIRPAPPTSSASPFLLQQLKVIIRRRSLYLLVFGVNSLLAYLCNPSRCHATLITHAHPGPASGARSGSKSGAKSSGKKRGGKAAAAAAAASGMKSPPPGRVLALTPSGAGSSSGSGTLTRRPYSPVTPGMKAKQKASAFERPLLN